MTGIEITTHGAVQVLRFARPGKKNAINGEMYAALSDALERGEADAAIKAHVFLGSGGVFTAGNDLADFLATAQGTGGLGPDVLRFIRLLPSLTKPVLAGVDGAAIGIGTTMLFHCDLVYATPASKFATPFADLGLVPEAASSLLAPRLFGYQRAFELLVLGEPFSADRALSAGLVNAIVPAEDLERIVLETAHRLAAKPAQALQMSKRLMRGTTDDVLARTDDEAEAFRACLTSPEARKAFEAFFNRRS